MRWQILRIVLFPVAVLTVNAAAVAAPNHCHLHRIWHYPWPQSCRVFRYAAMAPVHRDPPLPPVQEIILPDLMNIDWGHLADESVRGKVLLRAAMEKTSDH